MVSNNDVVLLPHFGSLDMVRKGSDLSAGTKKLMFAWSHYQFRMLLLRKGEESGCRIIICSEAYTTRTCGMCGEINHKVGDSRTFNCGNRSCLAVMNRDGNGARNVLIKALTEKKGLYESLKRQV
jgi:transposase